MGEYVPDFLRQRAFLTPARTGLIFGEKTWSFKDVHEEVKNYASKLKAAGVKTGDYVGLLVKNSEKAVFLIYALQQAGAVTVMLNHRLTSQELSWQLQDAEASYLFYDDEFEEISAQIGQKSWISYSMNELSKLNSALMAEQETVDLQAVCSIMYTSGTTGKPKGVLQTYGNHWWSAVGSALNLGLREEDTWLCAMPLFHISGYSILMKSVIYGMTVRLYKQFDEQLINQDLINGKATMMSVVSSMLSRLLEQSELPYHDSFRCMLLGGGPAPKPLLEQCTKRSIPIFQTYGMTETSSQIVTLAPEYSLTKIGSAGKPLYPCQIKVVKNGKAKDRDAEGEIVVKGPNVTPGYLHREEANNESFTEGWFHTGDIGRLDEEGFLYVLDRRSDLIISGGENIYPAEIESALLAHKDIKEAGVIGVADDQWGQVPVAFIVAAQPLDEGQLHEFCLQYLAKYKVPKQYYTVNQLPRNASNKLLRRELKEEYDRRLNQ
ncbi:O-succinylbenzoic acid--CoA ligase [Bacillus ectoiniformans]|uniref:o-succinylbenzoate--CoA ligase n=1 Tax=Bacillus ectoiniformans TaxID=1494429 RepID=UPI00195685F6|nr:o-succinylbenzoate--CoA ligase [Bacillus ectoiniformans]MBM7649726.1 O-succinylbenzoic acid--CoA ligase [Bacillus ectoiniformans]